MTPTTTVRRGCFPASSSRYARSTPAPGAGAEQVAPVAARYDLEVQGAVNAPEAVAVVYQEGAGLDYYIDQAGGYSRFADEAKIMMRIAHPNIAATRRRSGFSMTASAVQRLPPYGLRRPVNGSLVAPAMNAGERSPACLY